MGKKRIQIYADEETKRRIELAAARREVAVAEYCLQAIRQKLAEDDMLVQERVEPYVAQTQPKNLLPNFRALREKILARRGGKPIEIDILEQIREERDYELTSLR